MDINTIITIVGLVLGVGMLISMCVIYIISRKLGKDGLTLSAIGERKPDRAVLATFVTVSYVFSI